MSGRGGNGFQWISMESHRNNYFGRLKSLQHEGHTYATLPSLFPIDSESFGLLQSSLFDVFCDNFNHDVVLHCGETDRRIRIWSRGEGTRNAQASA